MYLLRELYQLVLEPIILKGGVNKIMKSISTFGYTFGKDSSLSPSRNTVSERERRSSPQLQTQVREERYVKELIVGF